MLEKYCTVNVGFYNYPNGTIYIVRKGDEFYNISDDGTGNGFLNSGNPNFVAGNVKEALEYALNNDYDISSLLSEEEMELENDLV